MCSSKNLNSCVKTIITTRFWQNACRNGNLCVLPSYATPKQPRLVWNKDKREVTEPLPSQKVKLYLLGKSYQTIVT